MANSVKNENSRVASKFLSWVNGSAIMRSIEQRMDSLEKDHELNFGHSKHDSVAYFQKILFWGLVYLKVFNRAYLGPDYNMEVIIKIYLIRW